MTNINYGSVCVLAVAQPPVSSGTDSGFVSDILPCLGLDILLCRTLCESWTCVEVFDTTHEVVFDLFCQKTLKTCYPHYFLIFQNFHGLDWRIIWDQQQKIFSLSLINSHFTPLFFSILTFVLVFCFLFSDFWFVFSSFPWVLYIFEISNILIGEIQWPFFVVYHDREMPLNGTFASVWRRKCPPETTRPDFNV